MPGISFLSPLFLIGAIAAAVPILLHLFHRKTEIVIDFPAVSLLTRAPVQQHRRRRLRELVLLALRVTALVLLAVSFARPYLADAVAPDSAPLTVIAMDTSMSLSAPGQIDRARAAAARAADAAPASHAVALVTFADSAAVAAGPTTDRAAVKAAIAQTAAGAGGTRYRTALARASELIGAREGRVVIVTDLQQAGWEANDEGGLPDGVGVEVIGVAPPSGNLAVTSAERRDHAIVASIQNYGAAEVRVPARLTAGGRELATTEVTIAAMAAVDVDLSGPLPRSGAAEVRIGDPGGYQPDNVRYVVLDPAPAIPVAVVVADPTGATGGLYLERALTVVGGGREFRVDVLDGRELAAWREADLSRRDAVFVLGTRTLDRAGRYMIRTYLARGGQVFLALGPDVDPGTLTDVVGVGAAFAGDPVRIPGATMVASDGRHPIFRPFLSASAALGDVQVDQYRRLNEQAGRTVLARFSGGDAALTEQRVGEGRLMIYTSDLDNQWSRFPLHPAFVPFSVEAARYLTKGRSRQQAYTLPDVPAGTAPVPGVVELNAGSPAAQTVAINVDVRESSPGATTAEEFTRAIERTNRAAGLEAHNAAREIEGRQRWWQVGLLVMLAALAGEALIGRRAT